MTTNLTKKVKILQDVLHYIPCSLTNARERGWQEIKQYSWGHIEMRAWETVNMTDIFALIAAVKAFQDKAVDIVRGQITAERETLTLKVELWKFTEKYLKNNDYENLLNTLKRLSSFQIFYHSNGDVLEQRFMLGFEIKEDENKVKWLTISLNKAFYDACLNRGLTLNFISLQSVRSQTARALYMYLKGQKSKAFYQDTLSTVLGLQLEAFENRRRIREAFEALVSAGSIKCFAVTKNTKGYLFTYEY